MLKHWGSISTGHLTYWIWCVCWWAGVSWLHRWHIWILPCSFLIFFSFFEVTFSLAVYKSLFSCWLTEESGLMVLPNSSFYKTRFLLSFPLFFTHKTFTVSVSIQSSFAYAGGGVSYSVFFSFLVSIPMQVPLLNGLFLSFYSLAIRDGWQYLLLVRCWDASEPSAVVLLWWRNMAKCSPQVGFAVQVPGTEPAMVLEQWRKIFPPHAGRGSWGITSIAIFLLQQLKFSMQVPLLESSVVLPQWRNETIYHQH